MHCHENVNNLPHAVDKWVNNLPHGHENVMRMNYVECA